MLSIHVIQQLQTGATFLKRAFNVKLYLCFVKNSISRVENPLLTAEGTTWDYNCNMAKETAMIYL